MNFLAHLFLAGDSPEAMVGSILPDLVRHREMRHGGPGGGPIELSQAVRAAVEQHRAVDAFTDSHRVFQRSRARIAPRCGIFAGVLADVFYDHFLASDWDRYTAVPLPEFVSRVHAAWEGRADLMPPQMRCHVRRIIDTGLLLSYASVPGVATALGRLSLRISERVGQEVRLDSAAADLVHHRDGLAADFHEFFPQVMAFTRNGIASQPVVGTAKDFSGPAIDACKR